MNKRSLIVLIISAALIAVLGLCGLTSFGMVQFARAQNVVLSYTDHERAEQRETRTFPADGVGALQVFTERGDIQVRADENASVIRVEIVRSAWGETTTEAETAAQALLVDAVTSAGALELRFEGEGRPPVVLFGVHNPPAVSFVITVPVEMAVTLESRTGNIDLQNTRGDASLKNFFGELSVRGVQGGLRIEGLQAMQISVQDVRAGQGEIWLNASASALEMQNVSARAVTLECPGCNVTLKAVEAQETLSVHSDFNEIVLNDIRAGQAEISNQNGAVTMRGGQVRGELNIQANFSGVLDVRSVAAASYRLENRFGDILLDGASGSVEADGDSGDIRISNAQNARLTLDTQQGAVYFSGSLAADAAHSITTGFGDVTLVIPPESAFDLDLETGMGKIRSDLPVTLAGEMKENAWQGKLNGGGATIQVQSQGGNIAIQSLDANTQP